MFELNFLNNIMPKLLKKSIIIISIIILLALAAGIYFARGKKTPPEFVVAKRGNLIQEVSVTGRVKPAESVDLAFEKGGKVSATYVDVGKQVSAGEILVILESADLFAQLKQAEANIKAEQARLNELKAGTRQEDIDVQKVKVENYKIALEDAKNNLIDKIQDGYTKADDAVRSKTDQLFINPGTNSPQLTSLLVVDLQLEANLEEGRLLVEDVLSGWKSRLNGLEASSDLNLYINEAKQNLNQIKNFLDKVGLTVNGAITHNGLSQTVLDGWKSDVSTARTNINTAINNITAAEEKLKTSQSNLDLAEQELKLKEAGTVPEVISAQEAKLDSAVASAENLQAQIQKTILRAPISGVVTKQETKAGEIVSANTLVVSIISVSQFEIEANVPEADIAKVKIGDDARVTLDAYGNDVIFELKTIAIDPAETIVEGVATYKVTFQFIENDERIKSGMTANIDILTAKRENVIIIPQRAVITKNGDAIVRLLDNNAQREEKIKTGLVGSDGNIEILEGINEEDKVITSF